MPEVGLIPFAGTALQVSSAAVAPYRSPFSKHQFTQPQLLAVLCLMRYEDWTFRETEVRLREHGELRRALQLRSVPDYTTLYRFLRRLDADTINRALQEVVQRMQRPGPTPVAIDGTGLVRGSVSTYFAQRTQHWDRPHALPWRHWLKWLIVVDLKRQLILTQAAHRGPTNDGPRLPELVAQAHKLTPIALVLADAEFDSERNHTFIRQQLGADSIIPAKRGHASWKIHGVRAQMRHAFPAERYRQRKLIETTFSTAKRKLSQRAPGRSVLTQSLQALLLGLSFNVYRLYCPPPTQDVNRASVCENETWYSSAEFAGRKSSAVGAK